MRDLSVTIGLVLMICLGGCVADIGFKLIKVVQAKSIERSVEIEKVTSSACVSIK